MPCAAIYEESPHGYRRALKSEASSAPIPAPQAPFIPVHALLPFKKTAWHNIELLFKKLRIFKWVHTTGC